MKEIKQLPHPIIKNASQHTKPKSSSDVQTQKKEHLHPRNIYNKPYNFDHLIAALPDLARFVSPNAYGNLSIDFHQPEAVVMLNKALLQADYQLAFWDLPEGNLCPPIPGRADYIHYVADLLAEDCQYHVPEGTNIKLLDIGTGASAIYAVLAQLIYNWQAVGCDIEPKSIENARKIIISNTRLNGQIEVRLQNKKQCYFRDIIQPNERFAVTVCNPPFHSSAKEASAGNLRKLQNLKGRKIDKVTLNFGGQHNELWCQGGEVLFVKQMIQESQQFAQSSIWFTCLVSKKDNLPTLYKTLKNMQAVEVKTIEMRQGQKTSRILAWTFFNKSERQSILNKCMCPTRN